MKLKSLIYFSLSLLLIVPVKGICSVPFTAVKPSAIHTQKTLWGEFNAGYSNFGAAGSLSFNLRSGKKFVGIRYNKMHTCYEGGRRSRYFLNDANTESHITIESLSVMGGIVLPGRFNPTLSTGISFSEFKYVSSLPIAHDVMLPRIWATIVNRNYREVWLSNRSVNAIGIPVELKLHFNPQNFIGFDTGIKADVSLHGTSVAAEVGIRFGRTANRIHTDYPVKK